MASPYTGQFGDAWTGKKQLEMYTQELEGLRQKAEKGEIAQQDYVDYAKKVVPILEKENYALARISSDFNSVIGPSYDAARNAMRDAHVYSSARDLLGRDITQAEFAQFLPRFGTAGNEGDAAKKDIEAGRAYLAELASQEAKSPKALREKAGQYSGDVNQVFSDLLKRGATQEEIQHFGSLLASGDVDAYTLRNFVQQLPEFTNARSAETAAKQAEEDRLAREQLGSELQGYDQDFFNKAKENVLSRYAQAGIQNSPSLDFALTNLMGDIQKERSAYLSDIARRDYESARGYKREDLLANRGMAREDYMTNMNRMFGQQDYGQQRSDAFADLLTNRSFGSVDYQRQQDDLMRLLSQQQSGGRRNSLGQLVGGLAGATIGGFAGGPAGVGAGYQIGSGAGSFFD